jgi:hypothetical protein
VTYFETLGLAVLAFLASAAVFVGAGKLDIRAGYDSGRAPLCVVAGLLALALAVGIYILLLPYIAVVLVSVAIVGIVGVICVTVRGLLP